MSRIHKHNNCFIDFKFLIDTGSRSTLRLFTLQLLFTHYPNMENDFCLMLPLFKMLDTLCSVHSGNQGKAGIPQRIQVT